MALWPVCRPWLFAGSRDPAPERPALDPWWGPCWGFLIWNWKPGAAVHGDGQAPSLVRCSPGWCLQAPGVCRWPGDCLAGGRAVAGDALICRTAAADGGQPVQFQAHRAAPTSACSRPAGRTVGVVSWIYLVANRADRCGAAGRCGGGWSALRRPLVLALGCALRSHAGGAVFSTRFQAGDR